MDNKKVLHRIQVDFDVEASSHEEAVGKVQDFISSTNSFPGLKDVTVLEENEENICATCDPNLPEPTLWQTFRNKNNN